MDTKTEKLELINRSITYYYQESQTKSGSVSNFQASSDLSCSHAHCVLNNEHLLHFNKFNGFNQRNLNDYNFLCIFFKYLQKAKKQTACYHLHHLTYNWICIFVENLVYCDTSTTASRDRIIHTTWILTADSAYILHISNLYISCYRSLRRGQTRCKFVTSQCVAVADQ